MLKYEQGKVYEDRMVGKMIFIFKETLFIEYNYIFFTVCKLNKKYEDGTYRKRKYMEAHNCYIAYFKTKQ